jgi:isopentenyl phosphate kinase
LKPSIDIFMDNTLSPCLYLKLGGSLITDKRRPETPHHDVINRVAAEIAAARRQIPGLRLVVGHGSGSFGHVAGKRYRTRTGVRSDSDWYGFSVVADAAARLNRIVTAALLAADIPAWTIQPSVPLRCTDGIVTAGPESTVLAALSKGLVPVVHGDVALDSTRGGTIASTEEIFDWLAYSVPASRLILLGEVDGIYTADPGLDPNATIIRHITPETVASVQGGLGGSHGVDVTGGMAAKVAQSIGMVERHPGSEIVICSGLEPGNVLRILTEPAIQIGTRISA